ncbi:hypothetical protein CYMTET_11328 [Cymbomonas tetramitiformis]|uniref:Uncharacterized protein n=1 Tax=Cymbomonas tetramitiformis TaxID=36881 RepID=A0AAE0GMR9_9CHLO|nr:hypothetical protein CYMTET_11328 [Cymbomonas tetramitiformis]
MFVVDYICGLFADVPSDDPSPTSKIVLSGGGCPEANGLYIPEPYSPNLGPPTWKHETNDFQFYSMDFGDGNVTWVVEGSSAKSISSGPVCAYSLKQERDGRDAPGLEGTWECPNGHDPPPKFRYVAVQEASS